MRLNDLLDDALREVDVTEGVAAHDLGRVRDGISAALGALRSSTRVATAEPVKLPVGEIGVYETVDVSDDESVEALAVAQDPAETKAAPQSAAQPTVDEGEGND